MLFLGHNSRIFFTHCFCFVVLSALLTGPRLNFPAGSWRFYWLKSQRVTLHIHIVSSIFSLGHWLWLNLPSEVSILLSAVAFQGQRWGGQLWEEVFPGIHLTSPSAFSMQVKAHWIIVIFCYCLSRSVDQIGLRWALRWGVLASTSQEWCLYHSCLLSFSYLCPSLHFCP